MERHPRHALADALRDQGLHACLRTVLGPADPDPIAVLDAALGRIRRIDLDIHVLFELGEPPVGARLLAAALVFDQTAGAQDQRELLDDALLDRGLLDGEAELGTRNCCASGSVGYLATRSGRDMKITSRWTGNGSGRFQAIMRALPLPYGAQPCVDRNALDTAREIGGPGTESGFAEFTRWMIANSCGVRSLSQPSFLSTRG